MATARTITAPKAPIHIGSVSIGGQTHNVVPHPEYVRFFFDLLRRVGGPTGGLVDDIARQRAQQALDSIGLALLAGEPGEEGPMGPPGLSGSGGGSAYTPLSAEVVITPPGPAGVLEHMEVVAFVGCLPTHRVLVSVAPHLDTDENGAEGLHIAALSALADTDQVSVVAAFGERTSGPIKLNLLAV